MLLFFSPIFSIEIIVVSKKLKKKQQEIANVDVINYKDIEALNLTTFGEILDIMPYIYMEKTGDRYSHTSFFIRGLSFEKSAILIDGIKLPALQLQILLPNEIMSWWVKEIEIYKGSEGVLFGEGAMAGAINIITKPLSKNQKLFSLSYSSFYTVNGSIGIENAKSYFPYLLSLSITHSDGNYSYKNPKTEEIEARINNSYDAINLFYKSKINKVRILFLGSIIKKGIPGSIEFPTYTASLDTKKGLLFTHYEISKSFIFSFYGLYNYQSYTNDLPIDTTTKRHRLFFGGIKVVYLYFFYRLKSVSELSIDGGEVYSTAFRDKYGKVGEGKAKRMGGSLSQRFYFPYSSFLFEGGIRASIYTDYPFFFSEQIGIILFFTKDKDSFSKLSFSSAYRLPSLNDLFWYENGFAIGNPYLKPEKSKGVDAEIQLLLLPSSLKLNLEGYFYKYQDLIRWLPGINGIWSPINIDNVDIYGAMLSFSLKAILLHTLHIITVGYGITFARYEDTKKFLPRYPPEKVVFRYRIAFSDFNISFLANYISFRYLNSANTKYMPSYFTLNLVIKYNINNNTKIYFSILNILDERYNDLMEYPVPGRELQFKIAIRF
jgi:iron complex outermembrane receptor protein